MRLLQYRPRGAAPLTPEEAAALRLKRWTIAILAVGFGSAIAIFAAASAPAENPLGEQIQSKKYLHDLEVYGGKANVLAAEFREWFSGLFEGKNLAYTVAVGTVVLVWLVRFFGKPMPEEEDFPESETPSPPRPSGGPAGVRREGVVREKSPPR
jgi:hypothetical protein